MLIYCNTETKMCTLHIYLVSTGFTLYQALPYISPTAPPSNSSTSTAPTLHFILMGCLPLLLLGKDAQTLQERLKMLKMLKCRLVQVRVSRFGSY